MLIMFVNKLSTVLDIDASPNPFALAGAALIVELHALGAAPFSFDGIAPLITSVFDLLKDGFKLAFLPLLLPISIDLLSNTRKLRARDEVAPPANDFGEIDRISEHVGPSKDPGEHELHENGGGEPGEVRQREIRANDVGCPADVGLEPVELLPDFSDLLCTSRAVDRSGCRAKSGLVRREVHGPLRVRKPRLRAIRRGYVEVVALNDEIHELSIFRRFWDKARFCRAVLTLQIVQNNSSLEHSYSIVSYQGGNFSERVDPGKAPRL
mmetsp:Transcript_12059/g.23034  ORF Transcript_12059/g.23034 Transcript_12059/m.23034 type:complete len:267 (+) Transcript_12059:780-1580(+)